MTRTVVLLEGSAFASSAGAVGKVDGLWWSEVGVHCSLALWCEGIGLGVDLDRTAETMLAGPTADLTFSLGGRTFRLPEGDVERPERVGGGTVPPSGETQTWLLGGVTREELHHPLTVELRIPSLSVELVWEVEMSERTETRLGEWKPFDAAHTDIPAEDMAAWSLAAEADISVLAFDRDTVDRLLAALEPLTRPDSPTMDGKRLVRDGSPLGALYERLLAVAADVDERS